MSGVGKRKEEEEEDKKPTHLLAHINRRRRTSSVVNNQVQEADKEPTELLPHINLKVKSQDGKQVFFRIRKSTQLNKLMTAYCEREAVNVASIVFLFDGRRIQASQTPAQFEMEDGDEIDAMLHQTGGCFAA